MLHVTGVFVGDVYSYVTLSSFALRLLLGLLTVSRLKACQSLSLNLENIISLLLEPLSKCGSFVESVVSFSTLSDRQND